MPSLRPLAAVALTLALIAGCGSGGPRLDEYVESLNAMNAEFSPRGESIWLAYQETPQRTTEDLRSPQEKLLALRLEVEEGLAQLGAPEQIQDLHEAWMAWHSRLVVAETALTARATSVTGTAEFVQSVEFDDWTATLDEGSALCDRCEDRLNAGDAAELLADTPWMPSDLTSAVHAAIGC